MRSLCLCCLLIATAVMPAAAQAVSIEELRAKYPPNVEALDPGFHWAPEFAREIVAPERARVPVRTDWPDLPGLERSPVTFGVPFADGALASARNARLVTADGEPVPADLSASATWWREDGPVRWLLVSATLERDRDYFIEFGAAVEAFEADGMTVSETAEAIVIDTGPLQATVSKLRPTLLDSVAVEGEAIVTPEAALADLPLVAGGDGTEYRASAEGLEVSFIRRGASETVVRREGWYTSAAGERFCGFITYTWFFAGSASVRHDHTLVVAFDTTQHTIRDIRLALPLDGGIARSSFSLDVASARAHEVEGGNLPARIVQTSADSFTLTAAAGASIEGERSGGWAGAQTAAGSGVFVAMRDFWQQYPMELEITPGAVIAHLWPLHDAPELDFTPSAVMGDDYPGDTVYWRDFYRGGLDEWTQGYGVAKTHNLQFDFLGSGASPDSAIAAARGFVTPVLAFADPEYAADTWAFGRMRHEDREQFAQIEALVDAYMHRKLYLRDRLGNYGWIDFGDVNYSLRNAGDREEIDFVHWRRWAQMFYGGPNTFPQLFMRSGRRDAWDFHRVNARHILDFDICHLDSDETLDFRFSKQRGGRYGGNGGICHYAANMYTLGCDCHSRFMLWDWYLNGNPRAWEVFHSFVEHYAQRRNASHNLVYRHRMTGGSIRLFSEAWEATWNPEYLSIAHQFADILYGAMEELGTTRYDDVYMNEGKVLYYQLTGDPRMRELFVNDMTVLSQRRDMDVFADVRGTTLWGLSHAWWFTGDESLLPYALWQLEIAKARFPTEGEAWEIGAMPWTFEHAYAVTLMNQLPTLAAVLAEIDEEALPAATGPNVLGNGPIYLQQTTDGELVAVVQVERYARVPGARGAPFTNWEQWAERLPEEDRPALVITAPDGSEAARFDLLGEPEQPRARFGGDIEARDEVRFTLPPDGQTGTYALAPAGAGVPLHLTLLETNADGAAIETGDFWVSGTRYSFLVPAGTGDFTLDLTTLALRSDVSVSVIDAEGDTVAEAQWEVGSDPRHDPERFELDAGRPARDEVWSLSFLAPTATFLRFDGVPGQISTRPDSLFVPQRRVAAPEIPAPIGDEPAHVESPLPGGGRALALPPGVGLALASPDDLPLLSEAEGTIEFWVRDARQPGDLRNRGLIRCGDLYLYRRLMIGTYLYFGPGHQSGMVLPAGRWAHLAATWRPSAREEGATEVALFIDGIRVETTYNRHLGAEPGWAGTELLIPAAPAGLYVDELRISDVARYEGSFDRPDAPFQPDEHTLVLSSFDDLGALVRGQQVQWQTR